MPRNSWPRNWRAPPPSFVESPVAHFVLTKDLTSERGRSDSEFPEQRTTNEHQSVNGFNATFGCATTDFGEGRVLQENPRTGAVMSVKVGAPKTYVGLLSLYNKEMSRLEDNSENSVRATRTPSTCVNTCSGSWSREFNTPKTRKPSLSSLNTTRNFATHVPLTVSQ
jgi:hypothetical protein